MAESIQQQLVNAVEARLKTIRAGQVISLGGDEYVYKTDIGLHVFTRLKRQLNPATDFPCIDLVDDIDRVEYVGAPFGWQNNYLRITADCFTSGKLADLNGRRAYADISAAVGIDARWSGLGRNTEMSGDPVDVQLENGGTLIAGTRVSFIIMYRSKKWQV